MSKFIHFLSILLVISFQSKFEANACEHSSEEEEELANLGRRNGTFPASPNQQRIGGQNQQQFGGGRKIGNGQQPNLIGRRNNNDGFENGGRWQQLGAGSDGQIGQIGGKNGQIGRGRRNKQGGGNMRNNERRNGQNQEQIGNGIERNGRGGAFGGGNNGFGSFGSQQQSFGSQNGGGFKGFSGSNGGRRATNVNGNIKNVRYN
jgi:hypothetical protein